MPAHAYFVRLVAYPNLFLVHWPKIGLTLPANMSGQRIRHCGFPYDEAIIYESFVEEQGPTVAIGGEQCGLFMVGVVDGGKHTCY